MLVGVHVKCNDFMAPPVLPCAAPRLVQGTLAALDTRNPVMYLDFPQGRLKLFGGWLRGNGAQGGTARCVPPRNRCPVRKVLPRPWPPPLRPRVPVSVAALRVAHGAAAPPSPNSCCRHACVPQEQVRGAEAGAEGGAVRGRAGEPGEGGRGWGASAGRQGRSGWRGRLGRGWVWECGGAGQWETVLKSLVQEGEAGGNQMACPRQEAGGTSALLAVICPPALLLPASPPLHPPLHPPCPATDRVQRGVVGGQR